MKKIPFALFIVIFINSLCFAEQPSKPANQAASEQIENRTFKDKVKSISLGDPAKGIPPRIVVIALENNKEYTIDVQNFTTIYDMRGQQITLDKINKGSVIATEYIKDKSGKYLLKSIKVVKNK